MKPNKSLALAFLALPMASCQQAVDRVSASGVSCFPAVPAAPRIPEASMWMRQSWAIEPRGVYTRRSLQDTAATDPTALDIAKDLTLVAGDYVGLQAFGKWYWGADTSPTGPTSQQLGAVFVDAKGIMLAPAKSGQGEAFHTPPTYFENENTDIPEDFRVPADKDVIVRVPSGATRLLFGVGDSAYGDNSTAGDFGVMVFEPNRKSGERTLAPEGQTDDIESEIFNGVDIAALLATDPPEATAFSSSPFAALAGVDSSAQWRGNYGGSGWAPVRSTYAGKRDSSRHWGWDIFAPPGSALVAPVWPSLMAVPPLKPPTAKTGTFGQTAVFAFKFKGKRYLIAYAHLDAVEGSARPIAGPEVVGYAGCSGLKPTDLVGCQSRFESGRARGMRNSHVHVGLYTATPIANDKLACDPSTVLDWKIR